MNQTDSPAFKRWFGDSKVRNLDGSPKIVYHATAHSVQEVYGKPYVPKDFSIFDTKRSELGSHFGTIQQASDRAEAGGPEARIYPVYLRIEQPIRLKDYGSFDYTDKEIEKMFIELDILSRTEFMGIANAASHRESIELLQSAILDSGFDGIVYLNRREGYESLGDAIAAHIDKDYTDSEWLKMFPEAKNSWIAFDPRQIKSAIGNRGTFDPTDPDIRHNPRC